MPLVFHFVCVCVSSVCASALFCTRQCSNPCDVSPVSEKAGNLGLGFSPEPLSFPFSSGMLLTGAHMCTQTHTETHTHTHINTQITDNYTQTRVFRRGWWPAFFFALERLSSFSPSSFGVGLFSYTLYEHRHTNKQTLSHTHMHTHTHTHKLSLLW